MIEGGPNKEATPLHPPSPPSSHHTGIITSWEKHLNARMEDTTTPVAEGRAVLINHLRRDAPSPPPHMGELAPEGIRPGELLLALTSGSTRESDLLHLTWATQ